MKMSSEGGEKEREKTLEELKRLKMFVEASSKRGKKFKY